MDTKSVRKLRTLKAHAWTLYHFEMGCGNAENGGGGRRGEGGMEDFVGSL